MCSETRRRFRKQIACLAVSAALASGLGLAGCGKQGPPQPPVRSVPAPAQDLTVRQQGERLLLSFAFPSTTRAGTTLGGVSGIEVWAVTRPGPAEGQPALPIDARQFQAAAKQVLTLGAGDIGPVTFGDRLVVAVPLPSPLPEPAQAHDYAVRTLGPEEDRSDPSNVVTLVPRTPPAPPEQMTVTPRGDGIEVAWTAREGVAGYNVYRRDAQERGHGQPLHAAGPGDTSFLDASARFGQSYIYAITAVASRVPLIESAIGSEREVRYQDRFPPAAPTDLVALAEAGQVRLFWRGSEAEDLAGYVVYRRQGTAGEFVRITPQTLPGAEYADTTVSAGRVYSYRVTAVDQLGNESPPSADTATSVP